MTTTAPALTPARTARTTRTIRIETTLEAPIDRVWSAMQFPGTFLHVARGLLGVPSLTGRTDPFVAGESGSGWLFLFHVIPLSRHTIEVLDVDHDTRVIRTHEHGGLLRSWDHTLSVEAIDATTSRYSDSVELDARPLTPIVAMIGAGFFRYRQFRWRRLARRHLST